MAGISNEWFGDLRRRQYYLFLEESSLGLSGGCMDIRKEDELRSLVITVALLTLSIAAVGSSFWGVLLLSIGEIGKVELALFFLPLVVYICLTVSWINVRNNSHSHALWFLFVAVPSVTAFSLYMIPGWVPDEPGHICQAYALFTRNSGGFDVPVALRDLPHNYQEMYASLTCAPSWNDCEVVRRYFSSYFDHLYFIPWLVLTLGKCFQSNTLAALVVARLANGLFYVCVSACLLKAIPVCKTPFLVFLLNPMLLQQEASCSADAIANIVGIAYCVAVIALYIRKSYTRKNAIGVTALFVLLLLSKSMYAPLALISLLFVGDFATKKTTRLIYILTAFGCIVIAVAVVNAYHGSFLPESFALMRQPLHCVKVLSKTIWELGPFYLESYAGKMLGPLSILVWPPCFWAYCALQLVVLFYRDEDDSGHFVSRDRVMVFIVALVDAILIILTQRGWSLEMDHREDIICGAQGRYFIPIVLTPLLMCSAERLGNSKGRVLATSCAILSMILLLDMVSVSISFL